LEVKNNISISCTVHQIKIKIQGIQWEADCEIKCQIKQNKVIFSFKKSVEIKSNKILKTQVEQPALVSHELTLLHHPPPSLPVAVN